MDGFKMCSEGRIVFADDFEVGSEEMERIEDSTWIISLRYQWCYFVRVESQ